MVQLFDSEELNYPFPFTVITICFGVELQKVGAPKYTVYVVIGYIVYHVLMEITLKIYDLFAERQNSGNYFLSYMENHYMYELALIQYTEKLLELTSS